MWREGDYWTLAFEDSTLRLRDSKGLRYLAVLMTHPEAEFHAVDLVAAGEGGRAVAARGEGRARAEDLEIDAGVGDAGEALDASAKAAYRRRLEELREEIEEAERWNDPERAERASAELEFVSSELSRAVGLGGRDRRAASSAERARVSVTRAIRSAIAAVEPQHPELAAHLAAAVRTGTHCRYAPEAGAEVSWRVRGS
jgi:hypothetical protein